MLERERVEMELPADSSDETGVVEDVVFDPRGDGAAEDEDEAGVF